MEHQVRTHVGNTIMALCHYHEAHTESLHHLGYHRLRCITYERYQLVTFSTKAARRIDDQADMVYVTVLVQPDEWPDNLFVEILIDFPDLDYPVAQKLLPARWLLDRFRRGYCRVASIPGLRFPNPSTLEHRE